MSIDASLHTDTESKDRAQTTGPGRGKSVPNELRRTDRAGDDAESNVLIFACATYLSWCPHFAHFCEGAHFVTFCPNLNVESDSRR